MDVTRAGGFDLAQIDAVEATAWVKAAGIFTAAVYGTFVATIIIELTIDGGTTVIPVRDSAGVIKEFTAPDRIVLEEHEQQGVQYRFRATAYTSGTAQCRFAR